MKAIKPFEVLQRSAKIKIYVIFYLNTTFLNAQGGRVNVVLNKFSKDS